MTTIPNTKFDTRLSYWRKILQKQQNQPGANPSNNLNFAAGLRRVQVKVLKTITGSQSNPYNIYTLRRLEALMVKGVIAGGTPVIVPNGLLTGLAAYYKMDELSNVTRVDSSGNGRNLTDNNSNTPAVVGIINAAARLTQSTTTDGLYSTDSGFIIGAGVSFTFSFWLQSFNFINNQVLFAMDDVGANRAYELYPSGDTTMHWAVWNLAGVLTDTSTGFPNASVATGPAFTHVVLGYDDSIQKVFWQFNNGARGTAAMVGVFGAAVGTKFVIGNTSTFSAGNNAIFDEFGFWRRALSTTDVTNLYNSGNALAFSSFTH